MASKYKYPNLTPPPMDPEPPSGARLGQKVETAFTRFFQRIIRWGWEFVADLMVDVADNIFKILQPGTDRVTKPIFDELRKTPGTPGYILKALDLLEAEKGESKVLLALIKYAALVFGVVGGGLAPAGRVWSYGIDASLRSGRPSPFELIEMLMRGYIDVANFDLYMADLGIPDNVKNGLLGMYGDRANPQDLIFGYLRGLYGEAAFREKMKRSGIPVSLHDTYVEQSKVIPPVQDLIRMMVREAFTPAAVSKFGLDAEYPQAANEFLPKLGLSEEWGKRYWAAHWQLPSPTQVFEMLHRGVITQQDMQDFLKTADYSEYWREKMTQISYSVLTRVDVRRLFQAGLIDRAKVLKTYQEMGYKPEDAELLTKFAETGASTNEKDLSKAEVLGLYKDGLQSKSETQADLTKMGYDADEAADLLKRADKDIEQAELTDKINYVEERYLAGTIDRTQAANELSLAGLKQVAVDRRLLEFDRRREAAKSIPTQAQAAKFAKAGIITVDEYREILVKRNYEPKYIEWYLAAIQIELEGDEEETA